MTIYDGQLVHQKSFCALTTCIFIDEIITVVTDGGFKDVPTVPYRTVDSIRCRNGHRLQPLSIRSPSYNMAEYLITQTDLSYNVLCVCMCNLKSAVYSIPRTLVVQSPQPRPFWGRCSRLQSTVGLWYVSLASMTAVCKQHLQRYVMRVFWLQVEVHCWCMWDGIAKVGSHQCTRTHHARPTAQSVRTMMHVYNWASHTSAQPWNPVW